MLKIKLETELFEKIYIYSYNIHREYENTNENIHLKAITQNLNKLRKGMVKTRTGTIVSNAKVSNTKVEY